MIDNKYIDDILSHKWKTIDGSNVNVVEWNEDLQGFTVEISSKGDLELYSYKEFFESFVIRNNQRIWEANNEEERQDKNLAGWLCVFNAMAIFAKYDGVDLTKEATIINSYVKERVDDAYYAIKNNLLPPWMEEKVGHMNFI